MTITLNGTTGVTTPGVTSTGTMSSTGVITASQGVGGTPAFGVYQGTQQSVTSNVHTKIAFTVENFDTANCFDSTTNYRFTPNVAGYYQINLNMYGVGTTMVYSYTSIYKNGTAYSATLTAPQASSNATGVSTSLIYMNGSTDYIEGYGLVNASSAAIIGVTGSPTFVTMSGYLARSA